MIDEKELIKGISDNWKGSKDAYVFAIIDYINKQPKLDKWIQVTNRLPKIPVELINEGFERKQVLVLTANEPTVKMAWFCIEDEKFYEDHDVLASKINEVIAWATLDHYYI